jgi:major membrane immunogen (membrane-anchored lipoprotein)
MATKSYYKMKINEILAETAAWRRKEGKSKSGGLNKKGVASYRRENPGSKLQTAVTTKPSKLKKGSKAAKRRKSFCARMGGVKGPMKKPNGKPTRKALALRKWNCESVEQLENMLMIAESKIFEVMHESHDNDFIKPFLSFAQEQLSLDQLPTIKVVARVPDAEGTTFGRYDPETDTVYVVSQGRHPKDVLRTLAHELVHCRQGHNDQLNLNSGATGSDEENQANAEAGVVMRNYSEQNPE